LSVVGWKGCMTWSLKIGIADGSKIKLTLYPIWDMVYKLKTHNVRMVIMRMKTQTTIRVDQENYLQAKEILKYLGLSYSQAINVFNNMIVCHKGLPFEIKIPNDETLAAMSEAQHLNGDFVSIDDFAK